MISKTVNQATIDLIKHFEGLHDGDLSKIGLQPKMCPAGIWTVGYGHALKNSDGAYLCGAKDEAEADRQYECLEESGAEALLEEDLVFYSRQVGLRIRVPINSNQFGALVSLAYNIGIKAFEDSSVLRYFNQSNFFDAADAFLLWNKCQGKVLPGLQKRREAEKKLFLTPLKA